jgi:hypothetical protein
MPTVAELVLVLPARLRADARLLVAGLLDQLDIATVRRWTSATVSSTRSPRSPADRCCSSATTSPTPT